MKAKPEDVAQGLKTTARHLREQHAGKDDEGIKRWLLAKCGWLFNRRSGFWEKDGEQVDPNHTLEAVVLYALG